MTATDLPRTASALSPAALEAVVAALPAVGLDEVLAAAGLQTRVDRKYLLTPAQLGGLAERLADRQLHVLDIDERRVFGYESVYFDTVDRALFRAHRQGRRRRYKVRTRTYLDSGLCLFEVKLKGRRGETVKRRLPYDAACRDVLTPEASAFLGGLLRDEYGLPDEAVAAIDLAPSITTTYRRATLVDLARGDRLTCDVDLVCSDGERSVHGADRVLVESKSTGPGPAMADVALARLGARPVSISKYCVGLALLDPQLPANRWNRTLRRDFGWSRQVG